MKSFSEKSLLPVEDILQTSSLKKSSDFQDSKTQASNTQSQSIIKNEITSISQSQVFIQEGDQVTSLTSQKNQMNSLQNQSQIFQQLHKSLENLPEDGIFYEGFIKRKQKEIISTWEERYIILTKGKLFFFENDKKNHLMGCIFIKYLPVQLTENEESFELSARDGGQPITLKGRNLSQHLIWLQKINEVIKFCKSQKKVCIRKFNLSVYEQKDFSLQEQFIKQAQTGDLLLVSSDNSIAYLQKFLTHSQFNHVAMIVRFKDQIKIFEANEDDGVFIYDWKQYLQTFKDHKRFAWRKLVYPNKYKYQDKLKQLIKKYIGRSYSIASSRMMRRTSNDIQDEEDRQFFCSQIIAKIFKLLGLLDRQISSVRYWPISFTSRGQLNLNDGAYFSIQKNILLSKHLKL